MAFWGIHMGRPLGSPMARPGSIFLYVYIFLYVQKKRLIWTLFAQGVIFWSQNHQNSLGITWVWRTRPPGPAKDKNVPKNQIPSKIPKIISK